MNSKHGFALFCLLLFAALSRLAPHPLNFTPVLAMGLYAGFSIRKPWSALFPLGALFMSDLFLGLSDISWAVYLSVALVTFLGFWMPAKGWARQGAMGFFGAVLFFAITNAAVWATSGMYSPGIEGLMQSYVAGLPFFHNTLLSTWVYGGVFLVAHNYLPALNWQASLPATKS